MLYALLYQLHGCSAHMLAQHFTCKIALFGNVCIFYSFLYNRQRNNGCSWCPEWLRWRAFGSLSVSICNFNVWYSWGSCRDCDVSLASRATVWILQLWPVGSVSNLLTHWLGGPHWASLTSTRLSCQSMFTGTLYMFQPVWMLFTLH